MLNVAWIDTVYLECGLARPGLDSGFSTAQKVGRGATLSCVACNNCAIAQVQIDGMECK